MTREAMSRDTALKLLKGIKNYLTTGNPIWDTQDIEYAMDAAIEALKAQPEWIPCSEKLPEVGGTYIVTVEDEDGRHVDAADSHGDYIDGYWNTFNDWYEGQEVHVIAWKPFPEPYCGYGREIRNYCPYCGSRNRKE